MKIWLDSHSYLNSTRDGYVSHIERFLNDDCKSDGTTAECVADGGGQAAVVVGVVDGAGWAGAGGDAAGGFVA